jgi:hypothetical protein
MSTHSSQRASMSTEKNSSIKLSIEMHFSDKCWNWSVPLPAVKSTIWVIYSRQKLFVRMALLIFFGQKRQNKGKQVEPRDNRLGRWVFTENDLLICYYFYFNYNVASYLMYACNVFYVSFWGLGKLGLLCANYVHKSWKQQRSNL